MKTIHTGGLAAITFALVYWFFISRGASTVQMDVTSQAAAALSAPAHGDVRIQADGRDVTLLGSVRTTATRAEVEALVRNLRGVGTVSNRLEVTAPTATLPVNPTMPFQLSVSFAGVDAIVDGLVPSEATRSAVLDVAAERFGVANVIDELKVDANTHPRWEEVTSSIVALAARLPQAEIRFTDVEVVVSGQAENKIQKDQVLSSIRPLIPYGVALRAEVLVPLSAAAAQCQHDLTELLEKNRVVFVGKTATLMAASQAVLDAAAAIAQKCPETKIEIAGHMDTSGNGSASLRLSKERAAAVSSYLAANGVARSRLSLAAPNTATANGRARKRRMELIVTGE